MIFEPLVSEPSRDPVALALAGGDHAEKDPVFPDSDRHDLARDLRHARRSKDPELWWPRFWLALDSAEKKGLPDAVEDLRKLVDTFRGVPGISKGSRSCMVDSAGPPNAQ